jgi:DNA-binding protein
MEIRKIITGYNRLINKNVETEELARNRMGKCISCKEVRTLISTKDNKVLYCNICKCILQAKIRAVNEMCPINKW